MSPRSLFLSYIVLYRFCQPPSLSHNAVADTSTATDTHAARPPRLLLLLLLLLLLCGGCCVVAAVGVSCIFFCFEIKYITVCSVVVVMVMVIEPGRAAVPQLIWQGLRHRHLRSRRCCYCCCCCCFSGCGCGAATSSPLLLLLLLGCCWAVVALLLGCCWSDCVAPVGESRCYRTMSKFKS